MQCLKIFLSATRSSKLNCSSASAQHFFFFFLCKVVWLIAFVLLYFCKLDLHHNHFLWVKCSSASETAKEGSDVQVCQHAKTCISRIMLLLFLVQYICHLLLSQQKHWIKQHVVACMANKWKLLELLRCDWSIGMLRGRDKEVDFMGAGQLDDFPVS